MRKNRDGGGGAIGPSQNRIKLTRRKTGKKAARPANKIRGGDGDGTGSRTRIRTAARVGRNHSGVGVGGTEAGGTRRTTVATASIRIEEGGGARVITEATATGRQQETQ